MPSPVVTRFAPSPTGFLHIGGARTALFNWLYARHTGGKMLLRIEDTDRERSTDAAIAAILDGLAWLELHWDGEPVHQFARADRHREVAEELVKRGKAYRAYETAEELAAMREKARAEGRFARYDGYWRDRDPSEAPPGAPSVVRIKAPKDGETVIHDHVQGRVAFPNKDLDDFIILRSDGTPTYMHAVVVDDHDMGVTHVIRGDDHLTNAGRQTIIYEAMGWPTPEWAHLPLIHGPDGAKLSKRHGALGVDAYRAMGYLPETLRNYLARLGWSHGDDEVFSTEQAAEWFELGAINKAAARFDFERLQNLNGHYMREADGAYLLKRLEAILPEIEGGPAFAAKLDAIRPQPPPAASGFEGAGEDARGPPPFGAVSGGRAARCRLMRRRSPCLTRRRDPASPGSPRPWPSPLGRGGPGAGGARFAEAEGVKLGKVAQPLRAALTGSAASPPIFDVLVALGREESLARIADQAA